VPVYNPKCRIWVTSDVLSTRLALPLCPHEAGAVVVHGSLSTKNVAELALKHGLPAATQTRSFAEVGGLMSYGADGPDIFRKTALYVTKILQGGNPANMPVEQPTKFELIVNLITATALGIMVPESFLVRADEVIE
jgi:putative tryptophan/tyrosine transport system substrate-binding protein